jgi:putative flippase GtrA
MCLSIVIANSLGWRLNRSWTFASREKLWWLEYGKYLSISFSSIIFSLGLMYVCVDIIKINYLLSSAVIAILMLTLNYLAHGKLSFGRPR